MLTDETHSFLISMFLRTCPFGPFCTVSFQHSQHPVTKHWMDFNHALCHTAISGSLHAGYCAYFLSIRFCLDWWFLMFFFSLVIVKIRRLSHNSSTTCFCTAFIFYHFSSSLLQLVWRYFSEHVFLFISLFLFTNTNMKQLPPALAENL